MRRSPSRKLMRAVIRQCLWAAHIQMVELWGSHGEGCTSVQALKLSDHCSVEEGETAEDKEIQR